MLQAAQAAAAGQDYPLPALYLVATPIGNLADITLRALHVLSLADLIACEDKRVAAKLLQSFGLDKPKIVLHAHNEREAAQEVIYALRSGSRVAYVSDAGTPGISDPGAILVDAVRRERLPVIPVPGVSSVVAAVSVAGDTQAHGFRFVGFLPPKGAERAGVLQAALSEGQMLVLLEAPHRIEALAEALAIQAPERAVTVCRELTKQFEDIETLPAAQLPQWFAQDANRLRGEFVVVIHALGAAPAVGVSAGARDLLLALLPHLPLKQAVALVAGASHASRNALYDMALAWKKNDPIQERNS